MRLRAGKLAVIAVLLASAATLKLVEGVGGARAQMPEGQALRVADTRDDTGARPAADGADPVPAAAPQTTGPVPGPVPEPEGSLNAELLIDLRRREGSLAEREAALRAREAELADMQAQILVQIDALQAAERALAETMATADQAAEADLARLISVFEAMRPEQAAAVVSEMAPEFAAGLIGRLQPATAATILAGLEPRFAYGLAAILAGRNAEVPRRTIP